MDLIDRYVEAVGARLLPARRGEVEAELRAAILDALDGRGVTRASESDVVAVLSELGEPSVVAAAYQPSGQYLIGPELYPLFRHVVGKVLLMVVVVGGLGFAAKLLMGGLIDSSAGVALFDALGFAVRSAVIALVAVVAAFIWMQQTEFRLKRRRRDWDPRTLPAVRAEDRVSRVDSVIGVAVAAIVLVVVEAVGGAAAETVARVPDDLRPVLMHGVIGSVMVLEAALLLSVLTHVVLLVERRWRLHTRVMRLLVDAAVVVAFAWLGLVILDQRATLVGADIADQIVLTLALNALIVAAIVALLAAVRERRAWLMRRDDRKPESTSLESAVVAR